MNFNLTPAWIKNRRFGQVWLLRVSWTQLIPLYVWEMFRCTFSLPARSTKYSFPLSFCSVWVFSCLTFIRKILWLLELCSFMSEGKQTFGQAPSASEMQKSQDINATASCKGAGLELTCDCYMSVGFALINCIHDFLGAADKSFSAALQKKKKKTKVEHETSLLTSQQVLQDFPQVTEGRSHLDIRYSVFVFVHR